MSRQVTISVVQANGLGSKEEILERQSELVAEAAQQGAQVVGLQEMFNSPYFCAEQENKWFSWAEWPDGVSISHMQSVAREHGIVLVVPYFERATGGKFFNTAAVIERDGTVVGQYRKVHIPQVAPCFWEKYYFTPGDMGFPVFDTSAGRIGVSICYDRHFPEVGRQLGLRGAEIVFNPSATSDFSRYLWELEQPAQAAANGFFLAAINRVGSEAPLSSVNFYGSSYVCDPFGQILARGSATEQDVVTAEIDLGLIDEAKLRWQFYRDRRPELYKEPTCS